MSAWFQKANTEHALIFYIDSSSVGAAVVRFSGNAKPLFLWSGRSEIVLGVELDFASFQNSTIQAFKKIITTCAKESPVRPKIIIGILSSPWFVSQTRMVHIESDKPFVVNDSLLRKVIADESKAFEEEHRKSNDIILDDDNVTIEIKNMHLELNGYPTVLIQNQSVINLKLALFISMSSQQILESFKEVVAKTFHNDKIIFHTLPFVTYSTLRDIVPGPDQFIFIDINGEITDLSIVNRGVIIETISFPLGYNFLFRHVAKSLATTTDEARTLLESYNDQTLHEDYATKLKADISYAKQEWLKSLGHALQLSSFEYFLPNMAYVLGHHSTINFFADFISDEKLKQYTMSNRPFTVQVVSSTVLGSFCEMAPGSQRDIFLFLAALFQKKMLGLQS